jgi:hypothetical protein
LSLQPFCSQTPHPSEGLLHSLSSRLRRGQEIIETRKVKR